MSQRPGARVNRFPLYRSYHGGNVRWWKGGDATNGDLDTGGNGGAGVVAYASEMLTITGGDFTGGYGGTATGGEVNSQGTAGPSIEAYNQGTIHLYGGILHGTE